MANSPIKRGLAGLGIKKPPASLYPKRKKQGASINAVRLCKNRQAKARYKLNYLRHNGKPTIRYKPIKVTASPPAPKSPIAAQLPYMQKVTIGAVHVTWAMGIARYQTAPINLIGYIVRQTKHLAWVYCPPSQASPAPKKIGGLSNATASKPPQYFCVSLSNNGLTQWAITGYIGTPKQKPPAQPASQQAKPSKAKAKPSQQASNGKGAVQPKKRKRQKPPTKWHMQAPSKPAKPKKAHS